ncbi:secreted phosphoprotein 24 [Plectropomus leopardus]|uniref:secreted phosphoprotein 24 n=1 Tax=Plectropomus leopardus TaxID=160734 RepID=UPI001C4CFEC7|nr:secreted phosphoprotein 24 [Plectropomus leopardus]
MHFVLLFVKMKSYVFLSALLLALRCSGAPLYNSELQAVANRGLGAALAEANSVYAVSHLYRVTHGSVSRVIPVGLNTADLMMAFSIKETQCAKASRSDPQMCAFKPGFFVSSLYCSSRVRMTATTAQVLSIRCGRDSSSSSESSEERFSRGRHQFNIPFVNREPAPAPPPTSPPVQPNFSFNGQMTDVQPRGDVFNNFLV